MRRNTLKHNAELSRKRKLDLSYFDHCKRLHVFAMAKNLTNMNEDHKRVIYQDGYMRIIPPIGRKGNDCGKDDDDITLTSFAHLYKLKYVASRSKIPPMKFIKHLGIYVHNAKRRYNA
jgi:hypothetical protein